MRHSAIAYEPPDDWDARFGYDRPADDGPEYDRARRTRQEALRQEKREGVSEWPEPDRLPPDLAPVPQLDPDLLPGNLRPWLCDVADRIQCPLDFVGAAAVVTLGAVIGRQVGVRPKRLDDWLVVPNLWGAVVGRPGILKSPALAEPMHHLTRLELAARDDHEDALRRFEAEKLVAKASEKERDKEIRAAFKSGDEEAARQKALAAASAEPLEPVRRRYVTSDATVEKVGELLAANPRGILVFRDELVGFLQSLEREGREGSRAFYLEAWNGSGRFIYDRIGRGTLEIDAACVSVLGGIQPGPLAEHMRGALSAGRGDDGLLQRFQVTVWPDLAPDFRNVDRLPDSSARQQAATVYERLDRLNPVEVGAAPEREGVPWLRLDEPAQREFDDWRCQLEQRVRSGAEHPAFEAHLAKYRSLVPSLALILHLSDGRSGPVGEHALATAVVWAEYLEEHARRLYAPALDPALAAARELDRRILNGDLPEAFRAREVYRRGWRMLDRRSTEEALGYLADLGRVRREVVPTDGRPVVSWRVNPLIRGDGR